MKRAESLPTESSTKSRRRRRRVLGAISTLATGVALAIPFATPAHAAPVECGSSEYIEQIEVEPWADGHQKIKVHPTGPARYDINPWHVTHSMWHAVQACVRGLYDARADSIYDQLECHQHLALLKHYRGAEYGGYYTGPTYDLETWRGTFNAGDWLSTRCGNTLGHPEPAGPLGPPRRPDFREVDPFSNVA